MASISPSQIVSILPLVHKWLPNRAIFLPSPNDREPLVGGPDLLGDRTAGLVTICCNLDRLPTLCVVTPYPNLRVVSSFSPLAGIAWNVTLE